MGKHHIFISKYEASVFSVAYLLATGFPFSTEDKRAGRVDRDTETTDKGIRRKGNHIDHAFIIFFQGQHHHLLQKYFCLSSNVMFILSSLFCCVVFCLLFLFPCSVFIFIFIFFFSLHSLVVALPDSRKWCHQISGPW